MRIRSYLAPLAAILVAGSATAQGPAPTLHGRLELSLGDALEMGLQNNLAIEVVRHDPFIAFEQHQIARGVYDPNLQAEFGYDSDSSPNSFTLNRNTESVVRTTDGFAALAGTVPMLGADYNVTFGSSDVRTNNTLQSLAPELRSSFLASLRLPLMKDLIWNQEWTQIKTTGIAYGASLENFRRDVMDIVRLIEDAYWLLIATEDQVGVAEKSVETARALLEQTETQFEVGVVSKVEVVEAEAGLAQRDFDLIVARNRYLNSQDVLIDLVLGTGLRPDSTLEIEATDRPEEFLAYEIDVEQAVERAFEYRPELAVADLDIQGLEVGLKFAENQRLPSLDVEVGYGNRGLAGFQNPALQVANDTPPPTFVPAPPGLIQGRGYGETFKDWFTSRASDQFTARSIFSIPLGNRSARARVSQSEIELRRAHVQRRRLEQDIIVEVRRAIRDLEAAQDGIRAAKRSTAAAAEQLRAERIRLEYGESTPFQVLLRESDYVTAQSSEIVAYRSYRTSVTQLDRAQGTILRNRNIEIDKVAALR